MSLALAVASNLASSTQPLVVADASPAGGLFVFAPPISFLPPRYFFKLVFLGGKNVGICDFGQKKP